MKKLIPFLMGAAVVAPLYLSTPAVAQSINDIQRLEERVNEAKSRGDWGAAQNLEVQLNMARLQYQRSHGMGEVSDNGGYSNGGYNNGGYYNPNGGYTNPNGGYYNPNGQNGYYYPTNGGNNGYYNNKGYYNNGGYTNNGNRNNRNNRNNRQPQQQGYYDQNGRWHRY